MAVDYAKVLQAQQRPFVTIGRGEASARRFSEATGREAVTGGYERFRDQSRDEISTAIVAVGVPELAAVTRLLLESGVRRIMVEKPAGLSVAEIVDLRESATRAKAEVFVGYNRRFYSSVIRGKEMIAEDGGVSSFVFEFTEWAHQVSALTIPAAIKENWLLANSSHVLDLAFFLGGTPREIVAFKKGSLPWHPAGSAFAGAGVTEDGALFSYSADWDAPGRWGAEILTSKRRLVYRPLEKLSVQPLASVSLNQEPIDDSLDRDFKPGLYRMVEAFLDSGPSGDLLSIADHSEMVRVYESVRLGTPFVR